MQLYITTGSPYARIVRVVVLEKGLTDRVEILQAKTRQTGSPYYDINPSGRVPYLIRDDGVGLEDSALICAYLDQLDNNPVFAFPADQVWEARRLEALVRSMLDGLAVLVREKRRPLNEQSPTIVLHETDRAKRMLDLWEKEIGQPIFNGPLNMVQIVMVCALGFAGLLSDFDWRAGHPKLAKWFDELSKRPSFASTAP
ncbi:MAG TPA: hypothetical protein DDY24_02095 [Alcaligenaceae bacterium]|nr:hypothetical protein [Alcaligenaceae bacterium]